MSLLLHPSFQEGVCVTSVISEVCDIFFGSLPCSDCSPVPVVYWLRCDFLTPVPVGNHPSDSGKFLS